MAKRTTKFIWTEQCQRKALLLDAMGYSDPQIAECLGCEKTVIAKHIGRKRDRSALSPDELQDLFEQVEVQQNMEEVLTAESGSTMQARLRTSLRLQTSKARGRARGAASPAQEGPSDEQIRREVEALVRHPIFDHDGPQSD